MVSKAPNVYLTRGLKGRDQHIDILSDLFEESQVVAVETADPALDLISFAQDCTLFWVINAINGPTPIFAPSEGLPEGSNNSLGLHTQAAFEPATGDATYSTAEIPLINDPDPATRSTAGFAYLVPSSAFPDPLHYQEYNVGIMLRSPWRGYGVGEKALHLILDFAFSRSDVHRVQVQLIDCYKNDKALTLFTRMGFSHEGTRRQGFLCPLTQEWKDVTTLGMLITDWLVCVRDDKFQFRGAPKSLWDALFSRHQKEREELLRWEEKRPHRSSSLETIRERSVTPTQELSEAETDAETGSVTSEREGKGKRKLFEIGDETTGKSGDGYDASSSEYESDYESCVDTSPPKRLRGYHADSSPNGRRLEVDWSTWRVNPGIISDELEATAPGLGLEIPAIQSPGASHFTSNAVPTPELPDSAQYVSGSPDRNDWADQSPSPEPREGSVISVPSSEYESEDGRTSSPASNWEMVEVEDETRF